MILGDNTKRLMRTAMNDNVFLAPIMHQLSHYRFRDGILVWLIKNNITGHNLLDWLKVNHDNSVMGMVKFIVKHHNKSRDEMEIILNRDWVK